MAASSSFQPMPIKGPVSLLIGATTQDPESQCGGQSRQQIIHLQWSLQRAVVGTDPDRSRTTSGKLTAGQRAQQTAVELLWQMLAQCGFKFIPPVYFYFVCF